MSKTMKKLVSMLVCIAMVLTTASMLVLADEPDDSANTNGAPRPSEEPIADTVDTSTVTGDEAHSDDAATPVPSAEAEATATPEPTEEPTPEPTKEPVNAYDSDVYYDRALTLTTALGIITGYEDGSVKPESSVTRAEMAAIVLRMLNTPSESAYSNSFNDVKADHWAANTIQTAAELGIINGMGDGSFKPDGNVTYEQAVKMIVCALGYDKEAQMSGEYPSGYLNQANSLKLTDHAVGTINTAAERGLVMKMVYNALITYMNEPTGTSSNGVMLYDATRTLAKARFNIIDAKGTLTATSKRTLDPSYSDILNTQIVIDSVLYDTELTGLEDYVGTTITYFYRETTSMVTPEVVAVTTANSKTDVQMLDLEKVEEFKGFSEGKGRIVMEKGSDKKCDDAVINYNGKIITPADFARAKADDKTDRFYVRDADGTKIREMTFDDLLLPEVGSVKLTDSNGDGNYDYVFIDSYETMTVSSVSTKKLSGYMYGDSAVKNIDIDTETNTDLSVTVIRGGSEVRARNLKADDVASLKRSLDNEIIEVIVTGDSVTGKVTSLGKTGDKNTAVIAGERYVIDANAIDDIQAGTEGSFYTDNFGRIGFVTSSGGGKLSGTEQYGWLMNAYVDDSKTDYIAKIFTQEGKTEEYNLAPTVSYWAPSGSAAVSLSGSDRAQVVNLAKNESFTKGAGYQVRLCKFRVNSNGQINKLYMAVDSASCSDKNAVVIDTKNLRGVGSVGVKVNKRTIPDGIVGFNVPRTASDMGTASNYSTFSVSASSYVRTAGTELDYIIGEFSNDDRAGVLIQFNTSSTSAASTSDYSTVADNPCMVVTRIDSGVDENKEPVYIIVGRRNGAEVSYSTKENTVLTKSLKSGILGNPDRGSSAYYATSPLWDAISSEDSIENYLNVGDVLGVQADNKGNAEILIKMVDIKELAKLAVTGTGDQYVGYQRASDTRDGFGVGSVTELDNSGDTYFTIAGDKSWYLSSSASVDMVEVTTDANGLVKATVSKDTYTAAEIMEFNQSFVEGDFIFSRNFKNDAQREAIIFRFND